MHGSPPDRRLGTSSRGSEVPIRQNVRGISTAPLGAGARGSKDHRRHRPCRPPGPVGEHGSCTVPGADEVGRGLEVAGTSMHGGSLLGDEAAALPQRRWAATAQPRAPSQPARGQTRARPWTTCAVAGDEGRGATPVPMPAPEAPPALAVEADVEADGGAVRHRVSDARVPRGGGGQARGADRSPGEGPLQGRAPLRRPRPGARDDEVDVDVTAAPGTVTGAQGGGLGGGLGCPGTSPSSLRPRPR